MRLRSILIILLTLVGIQAHAEGECPIYFGDQALKQVAPRSVSKNKALIDELEGIVRNHPYSADLHVSEILTKVFEHNKKLASSVLDFLVREEGKNSTNLEASEMQAVATLSTQSQKRLEALLRPGFITRLLQRADTSPDTYRKIADELRLCEIQASVCEARIRAKLDPLEAHLLDVDRLKSTLETDLDKVTDVVNQLALRLTSEQMQPVISEWTGISNGIRLFIGNLDNHRGAVREELKAASSSLKTKVNNRVVLDHLSTRKILPSDRVRVLELELGQPTGGPLLRLEDLRTIEQSQLVSDFSKIKPVQLQKTISALSLIRHHRATSELLRILGRISYGEKEISQQILSALKGRVVSGDNGRWLLAIYSEERFSAAFGLLVSNDPSPRATQLCVQTILSKSESELAVALATDSLMKRDYEPYLGELQKAMSARPSLAVAKLLMKYPNFETMQTLRVAERSLKAPVLEEIKTEMTWAAYEREQESRERVYRLELKKYLELKSYLESALDRRGPFRSFFGF